MQTYEDRMKADRGWALNQGGLYFEHRGEVRKTLRKITTALNDLGVPYAVTGGVALFFHGYRRYTDAIDILAYPAALEAARGALADRGFRAATPESRVFRDDETGVKICVYAAGDFPGDGKPKPVAFPDPAAVRVWGDGMWFVNLATLVEMKLAAGTAPWRMKDLGDAMELMIAINLTESFAAALNPFVRDKYFEFAAIIRDNTDPHGKD